MKIYIGRYPSEYTLKRNPNAVQKKSIRIDRHDTWSMAETLAEIILPMLKQLKDTKHGSPGIMPGFEETTEYQWPQQSFDFYKEGDKAADDQAHAQWSEILDKMIWSFEQICDDDNDKQFHTGIHDTVWTDVDVHGNEVDSTYTGKKYHRMDKGPNDTHVYDVNGHRAHEAKIQEGLDLFGKYYRNLWD